MGPQREAWNTLRDVIDQIEEDLSRRSGTKGTVSGRPKSHYSIYQKMIVRGKAFDEAFDLVAVRVLVDLIKTATFSARCTVGDPIPWGRFKDYIAMPKFNSTSQRNTTVIGPGGKPVWRSRSAPCMHERAEHGVAPD